MKKFLAIFLTIILIPQPVCLARKDSSDSRSITSSFVTRRDKYNQERTIITNRRFLYEWIFEDNGEDYALVLLEELQSEFYSPSERIGSTVKIKASREDSGEQKWEFSTKGDHGEVSDPFYKVTNFGCCDSLETFSWFSLRNGQKLFTSNVELIKIGENYFAYHDNSSSVVRPDENDPLKNLVGVMAFGDEISAHQKNIVRSKGKGGYLGLPIFLKKEKGVLAMASAKGTFPVNFELLKCEFSGRKEFNQEWLKMPDSSIKMIWNGVTEIVIPFEKDQLRFDCATYSSGITLEIVKPENLKK